MFRHVPWRRQEVIASDGHHGSDSKRECYSTRTHCFRPLLPRQSRSSNLRGSLLTVNMLLIPLIPSVSVHRSEVVPITGRSPIVNTGYRPRQVARRDQPSLQCPWRRCHPLFASIAPPRHLTGGRVFSTFIRQTKSH